MFKVGNQKKRTFIDEAVKINSIVPPAKYEVIPNLIDPRRRSNLMKGKRTLMTDDIATH
jgi:hypothetical protein